MKYYYEKDKIIYELSKKEFLILLKTVGKLRINDCFVWMEEENQWK